MASIASDRTRIGGLGAVASAIVLTALAGGPGAVVGALVMLGWYAGADLPAFALAILAIGALRSTGSFVEGGPVQVAPIGDAMALTGTTIVDLLPFAVLALTLFPLLVGTMARTERPLPVAVLVAALTVGLATIAVTPLLVGESVLVGALALVVVVAVLSYGLHRYGLLVSGVLTHG